jgi:hypothetical protein
MTKKDYVKIAAVIKTNSGLETYLSDETNRIYKQAASDIASDLAVVFQSDNNRFDQDRFLEACGL